jgi:outer membrane protein
MWNDKTITDAAMLTPDYKHQTNKLIYNHGIFWFIAICLTIFLASNVAIAQTVEPVKPNGEDRKSTQPVGFLYGIALTYSDDIYKGVDNSIIFWPIIGYLGERLKVYGPLVSYTLTKTGPVEISALLRPRFDGFDASDSIFFQGMAKRQSSVDIGLGLDYKRDDWKFKVSGTRDLLNRSDSSEIITTAGKVFRVGPVSIEPSIGLNFLDSNHVDYYYGVKSSEAAINRPQYLGTSATNTTLGIDFATPIFLGGFSRLGIEHVWFDTSIVDSPLTDANSNLKFTYSFTRFF